MKMVQSEVGSGRIETIHRIRRQGGAFFYEIAYAKDKQHVKLSVEENGDLVRDGSNAAALQNQNSENQILRNAHKVTFSELPAEVQKTLRARAGLAPIDDIDQGTINGRTVYQAAFKRNGQHTELMITEDGTVVTGAPRAAHPGASATPGGFVPLRDLRKVALKDLPTAAQEALQSEASGALIEEVEKGTLDGRAAYQATFMKDGKRRQVRIGDDGTPLGTVIAENSNFQPSH